MVGKVRHPMSTIQEYHGIVHQKFGGHLNESTGSVGVLFYRCATYFELNVKMADVEGTPFAERLAPYMSEPKSTDNPQGYLRKYVEMNAFLINYIFPTLDRLAPNHAREWNTLEDILTTPMYRLSLHRPQPDTDETDAIVRIDEGPVVHAAKNVLPTPFDVPSLKLDLDSIASIPRFSATDITFTEAVEESHSVPTSAILPSGEVVELLVAGRTVHNMESDRISNPSHFAIRTHLKVHGLLTDQIESFRAKIAVQDIVGAVTTQTPPGPNDADRPMDDTTGPDINPDVNAAGSDVATMTTATIKSSKHIQSQDKSLIGTYLVGILLKPLPPQADSLQHASTIARAIANPSLAEQWHTCLSATLKLLHHQTPPLYHGNIQPQTISVCPPSLGKEDIESGIRGQTPSDMVYLKGFTDNGFYGGFTTETLTFTPEGDQAALEKIFGKGGWLQLEMEKAKLQQSGDEVGGPTGVAVS